MTTRRDVMIGGAAMMAATAAPAFAASQQPLSPLGTSKTALSIYLRRMRQANSGRIDGLKVIDYVRSLGGGGAQLALPLDTDVKALRAKLDGYGMFFQGDADLLTRHAKDLDAFEKLLRMYKALGADVVRAVSFVGRRYVTFKTLQEYKDWKVTAAKTLDVCLPVAEKVGIPLAIENHKDRVVDEEVEVLKKYSSEYLGANVDFGNNISMCDDPMDVIVKLAPYAKATHMKDMGVRSYAEGFHLSEVVFGDGFLDSLAMWKVLKKANPALKPVHEMITRDPLPIPVLTDSYWATWPHRGGVYLARTLRMVAANENKMPLPTISNLDADAQYEVAESNNIRCFDWGRKFLA